MIWFYLPPNTHLITNSPSLEAAIFEAAMKTSNGFFQEGHVAMVIFTAKDMKQKLLLLALRFSTAD